MLCINSSTLAGVTSVNFIFTCLHVMMELIVSGMPALWQVVSLQWMMQNRRISRSCILGDEMVRKPSGHGLLPGFMNSEPVQDSLASF